MRVSGFMIPAEKVVTVSPDDTVRAVMDLMLAHKVGAVVVVVKNHLCCGEQKDEESMLPMPAGIITKSDIMKAYHDRVDINDPCKLIMGGAGAGEGRCSLVTCTPGEDRDQVARILEKNHTHHVIVVDEEHAHFVGIVSSWDVAAECSKDSRAWPYLRREDGKVPFPHPKIEKEAIPLPPPYDPEKPRTIVNHEHDEFTTYMDDLDLEGFQ